MSSTMMSMALSIVRSSEPSMFFFSSSRSAKTSADQCTRNRSSSVWWRAITSSPFLSSQWSRSAGVAGEHGVEGQAGRNLLIQWTVGLTAVHHHLVLDDDAAVVDGW